MSLSMNDARKLSEKIKEARKKLHLTQANCAELLDYSLSFQKDLERCRCTPGLGTYYRLCRKLNISADECIFGKESLTKTDSYHELLRLLSQCSEKDLAILTTTAMALIESGKNADN